MGELAGDPLLSAQFAIMAPQWASDALVEAVGSAAAELGAGIHLHSLESRLQRAWGDAFAGGRELERLADAGVLGDRSALAHGVWLRDSDIELVARSGATVVHNASSNLRLAAGVAPLRRLVAAGAGVALGLDDMGIADDDDMLAEVRMAHALQRVHGEAQYPRLRAAEVFGLMWDGGAKVIGAPVGRLEPGHRGDLVVADLRALRAPYAVDDIDVWELLVSRGKAAHVDSVVVGRPRADARAHAPAPRPRRDHGGGRRRRGVCDRTAEPGRSRVDGATRAPHRRALSGAGVARGRLRFTGFHPSPIGYHPPSETRRFNPAPGCASLAPWISRTGCSRCT